MNVHTSQFTPGPWDMREEYDGLRDEIGVRGKALAVVWVRKRAGVLTIDQHIIPDAEGEANARLIASAPDLLDQCIKALAAWEGTGPAIALDGLRTAIAKATGGES